MMKRRAASYLLWRERGITAKHILILGALLIRIVLIAMATIVALTIIRFWYYLPGGRFSYQSN